MTHTRPLQSWARLTAPGIPAFAVIRRPLNIGFNATLEVGVAYPAPEPGNFRELRRARQLYEQRRIAPVSKGSLAPDLQSKAPSSLPPAITEIQGPDAQDNSLPPEDTAGLPDHEESAEESTTERSQEEARPHHRNRKGRQSNGI